MANWIVNRLLYHRSFETFFAKWVVRLSMLHRLIRLYSITIPFGQKSDITEVKVKVIVNVFAADPDHLKTLNIGIGISNRFNIWDDRARVKGVRQKSLRVVSKQTSPGYSDRVFIRESAFSPMRLANLRID